MAILDWMMPGIDGIDICRRIRSLQPDPYRYLLLLTAKDDKHDIVHGLEAGADDYLTKNYKNEHLTIDGDNNHSNNINNDGNLQFKRYESHPQAYHASRILDEEIAKSKSLKSNDSLLSDLDVNSVI